MPFFKILIIVLAAYPALLSFLIAKGTPISEYPPQRKTKKPILETPWAVLRKGRAIQKPMRLNYSKAHFLFILI